MNLSQLQTFFLGVIAVCSVVSLMLGTILVSSATRRPRAIIPRDPTTCWRCFADTDLISNEEAIARTLPIGVCYPCADALGELVDMRDDRRDKPARPAEPYTPPPPCADCDHECSDHRTDPARCLARRHDLEAIAGAGAVMICDCKGYRAANRLKAV